MLIPIEMIPVTQHLEIRAVGANLPFTGAKHPELIAWIRLASDERPVDLTRLITLLDGLAPSISATLTTPVPIPTVEYTVRPNQVPDETCGPWLLLRAQTLSVTRDGWATERIDAWTRNRRHAGTAHQLRIVNSGTLPR